MKFKLTAAALAALLAAAHCFPCCIFANAQSYAAEIFKNGESYRYQSFQEAFNAWEEGTELKLLKSAKNNTLNIFGKKTLDLNGFGLSAEGEGSVLSLMPGSSLTVKGKGTVRGGNAKRGGGIFGEGAELILEGGTVTGNDALEGGGIYLKRSHLTMAGGSVEGNAAEYGGGIYLCESDAEISSSSVSYNRTVFNGGGIYLLGGDEYATLRLTGGALLEGNDAQEYGGGISSFSRGRIFFADCSIQKNHAGLGGAGLCLHGKLENTKEAYAEIGEGAKFASNTTEGSGGAVNVLFGGILETKGGLIEKNSASSAAGIAVSVSGKAKFGGTFRAEGNTLWNGKPSGAYSAREGQIEILEDFSGRIDLSMPREGKLGTIQGELTQGLGADEDGFELYREGEELFLRKKVAVAPEEPEAGGAQNAGGQNAVLGGENASPKEGERAIAILISLAAGTAILFLLAGIFARVFASKRDKRNSSSGEQ